MLFGDWHLPALIILLIRRHVVRPLCEDDMACHDALGWPAAAAVMSALALGLLACGGDSKEKDGGEEADAALAADAGSDAGNEGDADAAAEDDASVGEDDAGDAGTEPDDAGTKPSIDPSGKFVGCDLMEFAPENRNGQFTESAVYSAVDASLGYFQEVVWFEGGESGIWTLDALRFSTSGTPMPLTVGVHQLSGNNLGSGDDCTLCIDLARSDMDNRIDAEFFPEQVRLDVEAAGIEPGSPLKFTVSGIFREDADLKKRSWCLNGFAVDTVVQLMCRSAGECPDELPVCDYPPSGSYPVCMAESEGGE